MDVCSVPVRENMQPRVDETDWHIVNWRHCDRMTMWSERMMGEEMHEDGSGETHTKEDLTKYACQ